MVVRLSDIRSGQASDKKSGVVRLNDIRKKANDEVVQKLTDSYKTETANKNQFALTPLQVTGQQPKVEVKPAPTSNYEARKNEPSRKIPVIGPVLKGLDKLSDTKVQHVIADVGKALYTPGGTAANIAGFAGAIGRKSYEVAPKIASSLAGNAVGRIAQKAATGAATGFPLGVGAYQANGGDDTKEALKAGAFGAGFGGALSGIGKAVGETISQIKKDNLAKTFDKMFPAYEQAAKNRNVKSVTQAVDDTNTKFDTPFSNPDSVANTYNKKVTLALPQGNYTPPTRLKVNNPTETLSYVMTKIKPEVMKIIEAPARRDLLIQYVQKNTQIPVDEIHNLPMKTLKQLGKDVQDGLHSNMKQIAFDVAKRQGHDLPALLEKEAPNLRDRIARDTKSQVYGVEPDRVNIRKPNFNVQHVSDAAMPETKISRPPIVNQEVTKPTAKSKVKRLTQIREEAAAKEPTLKSKVKPFAAETDDLIKTKEPRLRDKVYSLLDEQEKAARARLAAKKNTLSSLPLDQYADHAVILAAKIGKGGIKLADATEYLVKEFGESIRPHAKAILNKSRGIVQETERRASKEAQDAKAFNEADAGDTTTFRNKVSRDPKKNKTTFAQKSEQIRTQFVDDLAPLEGLEKRVSGKVASAEKSLYKSARLFRGVPEKANQIVKDRLAPIVNGIEKQGYTSQDLGDYALAVHAKDVNARDIKSGFTNKEIQATIDNLGSPEMEAARKALIKVNDDMLKGLVDNQVITQDLVNILKERYPNYMPLFRQLDDEAVGFNGGLSNALANVTSPIKGLKGSEKQVIDPLENMVKNIFQSTNAAEQNKVSLQLSKLWSTELKNKTIRKLETADESGNKNIVNVTENGENVRYEVNPMVIRKLDDYEDVGRKNVVSVLEKGEKVRYEVEPEVYKSLLNLDKESSNMLIKILQKPASLLRAGATLTPEFSLRNPLRDVVQAFVTSNSGFNPLIDFPVGLIQSISKGNLYKKWVDELGAFGNVISNDRQVHKEALERVLKESKSKKFVNVVNGKSLIKLLRTITDVTESATKVGEFRAALRKGVSPQEAAYRSRDIMDFGRAGSNVRETNKIVAFLNANVQGKSKLLRAFKANPAGFTARAFTSITVPTVGVFIMQKYMANESQKKTIDESPSWLTDTFWLVPIPGTDQIARIPKPFDIGTLFSNLPERALKYTYNNDKDAFDGFAKKAIADGALPGMITGLTPFIEAMANYSFFRGSSIIPQREEGVNFKDQYDVNTTETAKGLSAIAGKVVGENGAFKNFASPRIMDNTIKGLTAGLGGYATSAIDVLLNKLNLSDNPVRPAKNVSQKPLAKAFLVNPDQSGKSTDQLYKLKTDLTTDKGSAKLRDEEFKDQDKLDYITDQTDEMSLMSKAIRNYENDRTLTAVQKRDKIDNLVKQRNDLAIETMKRIKEVEGK